MPTSVPTNSPTVSPTVRLKSNSMNDSISTALLIVIVILGVLFLLVIIVFTWYRYVRSSKAAVRRLRLERLERLPVHRALLGLDGNERMTNDDLSVLLTNNMATVNDLDYDGDSALSIVLDESKCRLPVSTPVIVMLLEAALPVDPLTKETVPLDKYKSGWVDAVQ
eukprot:gene36853-biopygen30822